MPLTAGARIGQYEIINALGAGGMGEVYRARDTKLGRAVAIKVLPEAMATDPERIARFEREAKLLASLNHPGIAALYGFEESDQKHFLVMELVEGETLADRIEKRGAQLSALSSQPGPGLPVEDALKTAHQIAEALEFAHEKGVVHRDLKPANIKITPEGKVKVLDFGLAKAMAPAAPVDILSSPTLSVAGTIPGVILGTAPYMSPEQAKGLDADQRSDIFSFGAVLYEMLTGRHAFSGDTITEVIASVLARQPDFTALPSNINPRIEDLIRRCLEKDVKRRRQAIADVRVEIEAIITDPHGLKFHAGLVEPRPLWKRAVPIAATAVVVAAATAATMWNLRAPQEPAGLTRFTFVLPEGQRFRQTNRHLVAISPDGTNIAYVADNQLYLRSMAEMEARPILGTSLNLHTPFFSPDGRWLAFHSVTENKLKKIAITGGASVAICDAQLPFGASWSADDTILIGAGTAGILRVSANGGKPETVVAVKEGQLAHGPQLLPDGDSILFTLATGTTGTDRWDKAQVVVHSLETGEQKVLMEGGSDARYLPTGHIVYALGATLLAVPFDLKNRQLTGGPVPIIEGVLRGGGTGAANVSFSDGGSMAYIPGGAVPTSAKILALVDRSGARKPIPLPPAGYFHPRISPDGKQLVVNTDDGKETVVWVYDLAGTTAPRRLTFGGANRFPIWSRDGQRVVFQSDREGDGGLFWQRADGTGTAERLTKPEDKLPHTPASWFPDGKTLTLTVGSGSSADVGDTGVWSVSTERDSKARVLIDLASSRQDNSTVSPDGRWVAYSSNESGQNFIYVQPLPPTGARQQITTTVGTFPLWSPDGKQVFYLQGVGGIGDIMAIDVQTQPSFVFGKPMPLPIKGINTNGFQGFPRGYDITPDGKQFLVMLPAAEAESTQRQVQQINVTLNWFDELKQRVPSK